MSNFMRFSLSSFSGWNNHHRAFTTGITHMLSYQTTTEQFCSPVRQIQQSRNLQQLSLSHQIISNKFWHCISPKNKPKTNWPWILRTIILWVCNYEWFVFWWITVTVTSSFIWLSMTWPETQPICKLPQSTHFQSSKTNSTHQNDD